MIEPIKLMVAGTGNPHVPHYLNGTGRDVRLARFVAVSDEDPGRLEQARRLCAQRPGMTFHADYREMFDAHPDADAVMIGSDNIYHCEMFREAVRRKLHIYMMKVISMNEAECREMIELARDYPRVVAVELELKCNPQFQHAKRVGESGRLGKIESIYLTNISQSPINYFPNWGDPLLSYGSVEPIRPGSTVCRGGALTDHPHPFDLIRWLTGQEFVRVRGVSARNQRSFLKVEDHVAMTGRLSDGTRVFVNPSYSNLEERVPRRVLIWPKSLECNLKITGTKGYFSTDFYDRPIICCGPGLPSPNRLLVEGVSRCRMREDDNLMGRFVACIRGEAATAGSTLDDSYQAVRVMNAVYRSIAEDREVEL